MKINVKKAGKNIIKAYATVAVIANTIALNVSASALPEGMPDNVDTSSYDAIVSIVFWAAGIIIASASMVPRFHAMSEGKANEDKRGFNSGLTAVIVGAVCSIACVAVRYIFF